MAVSGNNQLPAVFDHLHDRVQEFFLCRSFVIQKLDVVHQQHIHVPKTLSKRRDRLRVQCLNEIVGEGFTGQVHHIQIGLTAANLTVDGLQQVRLADACWPMNV